MAITSGLVSIILRYTFLGQQCETTSHWSPGGAAWLTAGAVQGAEAWWDNVKDAWRAMVPDTAEATFDSVIFSEVGGSGGLGEFAVPTGERRGERSGAGFSTFLPPYVAVGCRLVVPTRDTRPGQKRFPFAGEIDNASGIVDPAFLALCDTLATRYSAPMTLGAPVLAGTLTPQVASFDPTTHALLAQQEVVGYVLRGTFTSQVSRRVGHGI